MMVDIYDKSLIVALWSIYRRNMIYGGIYGQHLSKCHTSHLSEVFQAPGFT